MNGHAEHISPDRQTIKRGEETIRSHAKNAIKKMKQPDRAQAVLAAIRLGLIETLQT